MLLLPFSLAFLLLCSTNAEPVHVSIARRSSGAPIDYAAAAESVRIKWGYQPTNYSSALSKRIQKRQGSASIQVIDQNHDASYFASVDIGTPGQTLNVILDTGSSDLWVADSSCVTCTTSTPVFNPSDSSTSQTATGANSETTIRYGSGAVAGTLSADTVSMGGFTVNEQVFLAVDQTTQNLLSGTVSGIMGLAFETLASTRSNPFWKALVDNNQLDQPEMSFWLDRFRGDNSASDEEPGGTFTLGGTNSSLFTGDIEFINMPVNTPSFWLLSLSSLTVQGNSVQLTTGTTALSAIDTGTTLIGGPSADVKAFWAQIDGSREAIGQPGLYSFPCSTDIEVTMSFGGKSWPLNTQDMSLGPERTGSSMCLGGIFDLSAGSNIPANSGAPGWVVGATFLKNVYSVFRASNPPAIGFAQLSDAAGGSGSVIASSSLNGPSLISSVANAGTPGPAASGSTSSTTGSSDGAVAVSGSFIGVIISGLVVLCSAILL